MALGGSTKLSCRQPSYGRCLYHRLQRSFLHALPVPSGGKAHGVGGVGAWLACSDPCSSSSLKTGQHGYSTPMGHIGFRKHLLFELFLNSSNHSYDMVMVTRPFDTIMQPVFDPKISRDILRHLLSNVRKSIMCDLAHT